MSTIEFDKASFDDLDQYAMEQLVFDTGELSPILKGHLFIERVLEALISKNLRYPESLFKKNRLTFELKVDIARSLGLLSEKYVSAFKALNNMTIGLTQQKQKNS